MSADLTCFSSHRKESLPLQPWESCVPATNSTRSARCCLPLLEVCSPVELPNTSEIGDSSPSNLSRRGDAIGRATEGEATHFSLVGKKGRQQSGERMR
jgi:hypothetical protein